MSERTRRDQALDAGQAQAVAGVARDSELRSLVAANPGRWPKLERDGIRIQEIKAVEAGAWTGAVKAIKGEQIAPADVLDALEDSKR